MQADDLAPRLLPRSAPRHPILAVHVIGNIRLDNLETLIREFGTAEALAAAADTSAVYISMLRNSVPDKKTGRPREMGSAMARRLEAAAGKPDGWMDQAHDSLSPAAVTLAKLFDLIPDGADRDKCAAICQHLCALAKAGKLPPAIEALRLLGIGAPPSGALQPDLSSQTGADQPAQT